MNGCSHEEARVELGACQAACQRHLLQRAETHVLPPPAERKSPEEAFSALLGQSAIYGDGGPLKSYVSGFVSLPVSVEGSPYVTSVLGASDQEIWQDFCSRVMLSSQEYEEVLVEQGGLVCISTQYSLTTRSCMLSF